MLAIHILLIGLAASISTPSRESRRTLIIQNNCTDPIYIWSIGSTISKSNTLKPRSYYTEEFRKDEKTGVGIAIAITKAADGIFHSSPQLNVQYSIDDMDKGLWYDLATVNGSPFKGSVVHLTGDGCEEILWPDGTKPKEQTGKRCDDLRETMHLGLCKRYSGKGEDGDSE
jgi:hypothetical protein